MKYARMWTFILLGPILVLASCSDPFDPIVGGSPPYSPPPTVAEPINPPGLVGTFSGPVQNLAHTQKGTIRISITSVDPMNGTLRGTLSLSGFPGCFTEGVFPDADHAEYENYYSPRRGFGFIMARGAQPDSYTYLMFTASTDFHNGMDLNGATESLAFFDGMNWCLQIEPVHLERE